MIDTVWQGHFGAGGSGVSTLGGGWCRPERDFTWSSGQCSQLRVVLAPALQEKWRNTRHQQALVLQFDGVAFTGGGKIRSQRLLLSVNGIAVAAERMHGA